MQKLKKYREERKLSQLELALELDVSQQAVAKWESGERTPRIYRLQQMCEIFGCTFEELLDDPV